MPRPLTLVLAVAAAGLAAGFAPSAGAAPRARARSMVVVNEDEPIVDLADPDKGFGKVFVAGATSGVGRLVVDKLLAAGKKVVALARSDAAAAELEALDGVTVARGDALNIDTIEGPIDGCDAAISTLGGVDEATGARVDYKGSANVIEAAGIYGVSRIVLVTSVGCGESKAALAAATYDALSEALEEKDKAERYLTKYYTNTLWTVVRPGGLSNDPPTGSAILTEDQTAIGSVSRADVADLIVKQLDSPKAFQKIIACVDPTRAEGEAPTYAPFEC